MLAKLSPAPQRNHVYVYRGEGAGWRSVRSTCESLQRLLLPSYEVHTLSCQQLLSGHWTASAALLCMPGGADLPYVKRLNGGGNAIIKDYVSRGGSYLGLCAGAYYASARVEFEPGSALEVVGERELAFFPGIARGAAFAGFHYLTEAGAVAAAIQFRVPTVLATPHQEQKQQQQQKIQGISQESQETALHTNSCSSWCCTSDYCNGGPFFVSMNGSGELEQVPGVTVLARYCDLPVRADLSFQDGSSSSSISSSSRGEPAAALRCEVGAGVAVLCGTHPELAPEWLDTCGGTREGPRGLQAGAGATDSSSAAVPSGSWDAAEAGGGDGSSAGRPVGAAELNLPGVASAAVSKALVQSSGGSQCATAVPAAVAAGVVCEDAQLAAHASKLQQQLAASQQQRDLFLSMLLYEVLRRSD